MSILNCIGNLLQLINQSAVNLPSWAPFLGIVISIRTLKCVLDFPTQKSQSIYIFLIRHQLTDSFAMPCNFECVSREGKRMEETKHES